MQHFLLLKAIGLTKEPLSIIDATMGFGRDTAHLAQTGARITAIESIPAIFATAQLALQACPNVTLILGNSHEWLPKLPPHDVIYLDPMFPDRDKAAKPKKDLQLIQALVADTVFDDEALLELARHYALKKVVVKRPLNGPFLGQLKPNHQFLGKQIRFDVYLPVS